METDHLETSSSSSVSAPNNLDIQDPSLIYNESDNDVESLLEESGNMEVDEKEITWTIVKGTTECSRCKLINSYGYICILLQQGKNRTAYCCCSKRNSAKCKARVNQHGDIFTPGKNEHIRIANTGVELKAKVTVECINRAHVQPFAAA